MTYASTRLIVRIVVGEQGRHGDGGLSTWSNACRLMILNGMN